MSNVSLKKLLAMVLKSIYPVGSCITMSTNTDPATVLGFGTWELVDKQFKYAWVDGFVTWNSTNSQNGASACAMHGHTLDIRLSWQNKVAISDSDLTWGTIDWTKLGVTDLNFVHGIYCMIQADGVNAVGLGQVARSSLTADTFKSSDFVTRATSYPTTTAQAMQTEFTIVGLSADHMDDSFCDMFIWERTA